MKRILVVEDQSLIRNVMKLILEQQGYECVEAKNGQEAWAWLFEPLTIDLIVTDYHMPVMNGLHLVRKMKSVKGLKNVPIILFSGTLTEELSGAAQELGVEAVLSKPLNVPELIKVVAHVLPGEAKELDGNHLTRSVGSSHCASF